MLSQFISRHFKRVIAPIASLSLALLLAACNFEMSGEVNVGADGAGEIVSSIAFPKQEYQMLPSNQKRNFCGQFNEQGKLGKVELVSRGEKVLCLFKKPFANIKQLKEDGFIVTPQKDGTIELSIDLTTIAKAMGLEDDKNLQQASQRQGQRFTWQQHNKDMASLMRMGMLADKSLNITVNAPHIVETNGIVSEDRKSAEYGVPLMEVMDGNTKLHSKLQGQMGGSGQVAFSPNAKRIVTLSNEGVWLIKMWDVASGRLLKVFGKQLDGLNTVAYSPDGRYILAGGKDTTIRIWNAKNGNLIRTLRGHSKSINSATYSTDGRRIISSTKDTMLIWNAETGKLIRTLKGGGWINPSSNSISKYIILNDHPDRTVWDLTTYKKIRSFKIKRNVFVEFSGDGSLYVSGNEKDGVFTIYDTLTGKVLGELDRKFRRIDAISFSSDGQRVATFSYHIDNDKLSKNIRIWNVATGKQTAKFKLLMRAPISQIAFSPNRTLIIALGRDVASKPSYLEIYNIKTGKRIINKRSRRYWMHDMFSPSNELFLTTDAKDKYGFVTKTSIWKIVSPIHFKTRFYCYKRFWGSKGC